MAELCLPPLFHKQATIKYIEIETYKKLFQYIYIYKQAVCFHANETMVQISKSRLAMRS